MKVFFSGGMAFGQKGIDGTITEAALAYLPAAQGPAHKFWHAVVIVNMDEECVHLHDPEPQGGGPNRRVERGVFFGNWIQCAHSAYRV